jgi:hypothetical protein
MKHWVVLVVASVTAAAAATASAPPAPMQNVSWPSGFAAAAAAGEGWTPYRTEVGGYALRLWLPPQWVEQTSRPEGMMFSAQDSGARMILQIRQLEPVNFNLQQPLPNATIQEMRKTVADNLAERGYELSDSGQVLSAKRVWLWNEARMTDLGAFAALGPIGGGQTWIFSTTPHSQRLEVNYFVLHARDDSAAQIEGRVREAGAVFKAILERLTVEPR